MSSTSTGASDSMPSTAMPSASLSSTSARPGCVTASVGSALAHLVGEQQLAARRRPEAVLGDLEGALVGDLEPAHLLDGVAPELDPQRVLLGRREHVEDAAAHRELAAPLDQVDPGVGGRREPRDHLVEVDLVAGAQRDRLQVAEARRPSAAARARTGATTTWTGPWPASSASGWASRRSTASRRPTVSLRGLSRSCGSVSQAGNSTTASGVEQVAQGGGQLLGLAAGRGDGEHRPAGPGGERGQGERADARRGGEVQVGAAAGAGGLDRGAQRGLAGSARRAGRRGRRSGSRKDSRWWLAQHGSPGPQRRPGSPSLRRRQPDGLGSAVGGVCSPVTADLSSTECSRAIATGSNDEPVRR